MLLSFGITVAGLLMGLVLSFCGWVTLYEKRRVFGAALLGSGWLCGALAIGSLWLSK